MHTIKVVFIAKTDINTDGRILNQLRILESSNVNLSFLLFADKPIKLEFGSKVKVYQIKTFIRNNKYFRFFTVLDFTYKSLKLLIKLKPEILHAQDSAVVLPVLIYRFIKGKSLKLIYDDHEMPNSNQGIQNKIFNFFEVLLMKLSNWVIFANEERMKILKEKYNLENKITYFLNLPYYEEIDAAYFDIKSKVRINELLQLKRKGIKFIIHQGILHIERGREKLANFSKLLPPEYKILLLGGNKDDFNAFILQFDLNSNNFCFIGSVNYTLLSKFWELADASIVMYLPKYQNNRLCAPNRFYFSVKMGIPVLVNKDNPVLKNFIKEYKCGFFIEDINSKNFNLISARKQMKIDFTFEKIKDEQIKNFISIYESLI